jgi:localization factor PodJL
MQPDLPWNVAGIPPEAREAARAAARREGLSVGEWLTRRIVRSLADGAEIGNRDDGAHAMPGNRRAASENEPATTARDAEDMFARISRSENETSSAYRKIEEQLRGLGRRLEAAERSQTDNSRAVSKAATEINIATREQAQAFEQLGAHVADLGGRLVRVERAAANDGLKDAVKGLHAGLSRLADQIAETANQSASQIAALAGNIESVAGKLGDARNDAETTANALAERISAFDERVRTAERAIVSNADKLGDTRNDAETTAHALAEQISAFDERVRSAERAILSNADKLSDARDDADSMAHALAERISAFDERVRSIERATLSNSDKLEKTIAGIETAQAAQHSEEPENARKALAVAQLTDTLDKVAARLAATESRTAGAIARLEHQVAELDAHQVDPAIDRRLKGIEHTLSDMAGRLEITERNTAGTARAVEENLHDLSVRVDSADKRHRDAIIELRDILTALPARPEPAPGPSQASQTAVLQTPDFDLPPFPEVAAQPSGIEQPVPSFGAADPEAELPPFAGPDFSSDHPFVADAFIDPATQPQAEANDSFIAAARRSARTASAVEAQPSTQGGFTGFTWGATAPAQQPQPEAESTRFVLFALIGLIAIGAVIAGFLLSRGLVGNEASTIPLPPPQLHDSSSATAPSSTTLLAAAQPSPAARVEDVPSDTERASTNTAPVTTAAPGLPVATFRHPRSTTAAVDIKPAPPVQTTVTAAPQSSEISAPAKAQPAPVPTLDRLNALANAGSAKAELLVGLRYLDGDGIAVNEAEAAKWLQRAANQGEAVAAYRLGTLFERGHGVPADTSKALQLYETAARLGNRKAMHNLAVAYAEGSGTQKDLTAAAQWFSKAASLGLADSEFNLAVLYERGMGVQQSLIDAYKWYAIASAQGDAESKARLDVISSQLSADERAAAQRAAADFRPAPIDRDANMPPDPSTLN